MKKHLKRLSKKQKKRLQAAQAALAGRRKVAEKVQRTKAEHKDGQEQLVDGGTARPTPPQRVAPLCVVHKCGPKTCGVPGNTIAQMGWALPATHGVGCCRSGMAQLAVQCRPISKQCAPTNDNGGQTGPVTWAGPLRTVQRPTINLSTPTLKICTSKLQHTPAQQ